MGRLLLIDGNSIMNRAFYAVIGRAPMTAPDGTPTGAVNGFFNTLLSVVDEYSPTGICVLFDLKAPTFRHMMSSEYKATRKGMPDELAAQMPVVKDLLDRMGISRMELEGYEADDLIGTLSRMGEEAGDTVYILSGDHDDYQLISDNVSVLMPQSGKGKPPRILVDREFFETTYGVKPEVFVDVKALMGDNSDNIKGVEKVGEKTAFKLIAEYGSVEGVLANTASMSEGLRNKLDASHELLDLNLKLCRIDRDVPVPFGLDKTAYNGITDRQATYDRLSSLALKMLIKKLGLEGMHKSAAALAEEGEGDADDPFASALYDEYKEMAGRLTVSENISDLHITSETRPGIAFIDIGGKAAALVAVKGSAVVLKIDVSDLKTVVAQTEVMPVAFDYKTRSKVLDEPLKVDGVFDTAIAGYVFNLIDGSTPDFPRLVESLFLKPYPIEDEDIEPKQLSLFDEQDGQDEGKKLDLAVRKLYLNLLCAELLDRMIEQRKAGRLLYEIEFPLVVTLDIIERNGMNVSGDKLDMLHEEFSSRLSQIEKEIYSSTGYEFNISSPKQLADILYGEDKLNLPHGKKGKTGVFSTSIDELKRIRSFHPAIDMIIEYRALSKLDSTYATGLRERIDADGRVRTTFTQAMTNTGRLSSTEPNLQNIPVRTENGGRIRECFTAPEGRVLVDADYSQIELRLLAAMSGDKIMSEAFREGEDIHRRTASKVYGIPEELVTPAQRAVAKTVNFSIIYGISEFGLAQDLDISFKEAGELIRQYGIQFPEITSYLEALKTAGEKLGYVETMFGRRRNLSELKSQNRNIRNFGLRVAMNTPIQGSAADIIKIAMNKVRKALTEKIPGALLIMQVHDELIVECDEADRDKVSTLLKEEMENAVDLSVPLVADVHSGNNWLEAK